ncbi:MAG: D-glycerate dehydrogenase [Candidatus Aminicenantes bacterium]|nr:D-glycerate dehydrogenase [Candidatus Aminicenantes bacterium]
MKPKVLITHNLFPEVLEYMGKYVDYEIGKRDGDLSKNELIEKIKDKAGLLALLVDTIDEEVLSAAPSLKIIANCAVGTNNIDITSARKRGIMVTNTPGVLTETTAELTWALIFAVARRIPQAHIFTQNARYKGWALDLFLGKELYRKRLGIVGMGRIGQSVALKARAFSMDIVYTDPHRLNPEEESNLQATQLSLEDLLRTSDIITLHTTLTSKTFHLISEKNIHLMKNSAILINVSRGPVVEERALADALEKGMIWGAGLDVYEDEPAIHPKLIGLDNIVLLPHIGSATLETRSKMAFMAANNLIQGLRGETPDNLI